MSFQTRLTRWWPCLALAASPAFAQSDLSQLSKDPKNWAMQSGDVSNQRYSELKQINSKNAKNLQVAWTFSTGVLRGHEGGPLIIGDTMYLHSPFPNKVFALSLEDQSIRWKYEPKQDPTVIPVMCCDTVNRGLAYSNGKIFLQQADTTLVALDAKTGAELWKTKVGDPKVGETTTNAPHIFKDKLLTGISGGEFGVRGRIAAYDPNTGKLLWKAYSTGPDKDMLIDPGKTMTWTDGKMAPVGPDSSLKSWQGDQWKLGGGTTWGWYSYDPQLNLVYYGSGNPSTWNPRQRPGDNKWSMTIFARDLDTGAAKWVYQMTPHDEWDYDGVNEMVLADLNINGKQTKALVHFDRNGFGYTVDRTNGKVLVAQPFGPGVNWASKIDLATGVPVRNPKYGTTAKENTTGICPAAIGYKDQQPSAFSPKTGLFYVPTNNICMDYEGVEVKYAVGQPYVGAIVRMFPGPGGNRGRFIAWDATKGKVVWEIKESLAAYGGALTTASGLVFYGTMEGWLKAVDGKTGKELWRFKTPSGIIGNPMTYLGPDGKQYVAVLSGIGGWAGIGVAAGISNEDPTAGLGALGAFGDADKFSTQGGVLTVFGLNQKVASK
ncbi:MAG: methanol/ethanol family PQQ-dependent dehydrogenase [Myxococcales bacterium]